MLPMRKPLFLQRLVTTAKTALLSVLLLCDTLPTVAHADMPRFILPKSSLAPEDVAVIVNDDDPLSRKITEYYRAKRLIPEANIVHVRFSAKNSTLTRGEFARIKKEVDSKTPASIQAFVLTWAAPYRVECMSITTAFALGFDEAYCSHDCAATKPSSYFNSASLAPFRDHKLRPTMALAGNTFDEVKALIDRGVAADGTHPRGTAYLVSTSDKARNVRAAIYPAIMKRARDLVEMQLIEADAIEHKQDVLFYFTGMLRVPALDTLHFEPGAIADHLTSAGGQLTDSPQMSSLRWLEAGATGSYGAVVEPCNHPGKFPNPALVIFWYLQGASLIEAYWKSVAMPGEGIFIGEPLAKPFDGYDLSKQGDEIVLTTRVLQPGTYAVLGANSVIGPFSAATQRIVVPHQGKNQLRLQGLGKPVYQLVKLR